MVTSLECSCSLCDSTKHVGFLQGEMVLLHRLASTTIYRSHILSLQKKERLVSKVLFHNLIELIYDVVLLRPTDNDRYVRNAPENPKKVSEFIKHSIGGLIYLFIFQTLFHYDGVYGLMIHKYLF
jgi:hypothetical protein